MFEERRIRQMQQEELGPFKNEFIKCLGLQASLGDLTICTESKRLNTILGRC